MCNYSSILQTLFITGNIKTAFLKFREPQVYSVYFPLTCSFKWNYFLRSSPLQLLMAQILSEKITIKWSLLYYSSFQYSRWSAKCKDHIFACATVKIMFYLHKLNLGKRKKRLFRKRVALKVRKGHALCREADGVHATPSWGSW